MIKKPNQKLTVSVLADLFAEIEKTGEEPITYQSLAIIKTTNPWQLLAPFLTCQSLVFTYFILDFIRLENLTLEDGIKRFIGIISLLAIINLISILTAINCPNIFRSKMDHYYSDNNRTIEF